MSPSWQTPSGSVLRDGGPTRSPWPARLRRVQRLRCLVGLELLLEAPPHVVELAAKPERQPLELAEEGVDVGELGEPRLLVDLEQLAHDRRVDVEAVDVDAALRRQHADGGVDAVGRAG